MTTQVLVYIHLSENREHIPYTIPLLQWTAENLPDVSVFDMDNDSERQMADFAVKMIREASQAVIVVNNAGDEKTPVGTVLSIFQKLERMKTLSSVSIFSVGAPHPVITKISRGLRKVNFIQRSEVEEIKQELRLIFNPN